MYDQFVGFGAESVWGTLVARSEFHRMYGGTIIDPQHPREPVAYMGYADPTEVFDKPASALFKAIVPMVYQGIELLMEHCWGLKTTSGAGPYDHVYTYAEKPYTRAASPLVGLSVEAHGDFPDSGYESMLLEGGRVTEFGAGFTVGEEIQWTVDGVGETAPDGPKTASPTFPAYDAITVVPSQVLVEIDDTQTEVFGIDFQANKNLRTDRAFLGSANIAAPLTAPGKRGITGTISKEWEDRTLYNKFRNKTEAKIEVIGTLDVNRNFNLLFPRVLFTGDAPEPNEGEYLEHQLAFMCLRHTTDGLAKLTLTNQQA